MYDHGTDSSHHLNRVSSGLRISARYGTFGPSAIMIYVPLSIACESGHLLKLFERRNWQLPRRQARPLPTVRLYPRSEPTLAFETS